MNFTPSIKEAHTFRKFRDAENEAVALELNSHLAMDVQNYNGAHVIAAYTDYVAIGAGGNGFIGFLGYLANQKG